MHVLTKRVCGRFSVFPVSIQRAPMRVLQGPRVSTPSIPGVLGLSHASTDGLPLTVPSRVSPMRVQAQLTPCESPEYPDAHSGYSEYAEYHREFSKLPRVSTLSTPCEYQKYPTAARRCSGARGRWCMCLSCFRHAGTRVCFAAARTCPRCAALPMRALQTPRQATL
jgi:hypothetical protein